MRGHVSSYETTSGKRWRIVYELPADTGTGKRRQTSRRGFETRRQAEEALRRALGRLDDGTHVDHSGRTVADYLRSWVAGLRRRANTVARYRTAVEAYMIPRIGHIRLQRLTVEHLDEMYRDLEARGGRRGQPLSPTTVRHCHNILHKALDDAMRRSLVVRNVADWADPPPLERREMEIWTAKQLRSFLDHVDDDRLYALWLLACTTGMRRGELAGLRWKWVDLDRGRLTIATQTTVVDGHAHEEDPKSAKGRRTIALDATTVAALRGHRKRQAEEQLAAGPAWEETGRVFVWPDGRPIHPKRILDWLRRLAADLGLPPIRVHDLRHAWATAALEAGVELKVVSTRLGHARTAITADIYQHVTDRLDQEAADTVAASILGRSLSDVVTTEAEEAQNGR